MPAAVGGGAWMASSAGGAFGPSGEGHVRMCYATSEDKIREALARIGRFVERVRPRAGAWASSFF